MQHSTALCAIENKFLKKNLPKIDIGDNVKIGVLIQEGNKQRVQPYSGTVIASHLNGINSTITIRRIFQGVGIERVFLTHSPCYLNIEILRHSKVRRNKLYYLRERVGKAARLKTKLKSKGISS